MTPSRWPELDYDRWRATGQSLHMWSQIVGKFRLANTPWINHSWHATSYVSGRGLTTGLVHTPTADVEVIFDLVEHSLHVLTTDDRQMEVRLEPMSVAQFRERFIAALDAVDAPSRFHHFPNEVPDPKPFAEQTLPGAYDPQAATAFWRALVRIDAVFERFRSGFLGKVSPAHLFWGSFDFAITRFSGRPAPRHPGGFPSLPDAVTREAYSHEVSSAGFWPGGGGVDEACFYAYAYPSPDGFADAKVGPDGASFHQELGEFVLPYAAVRAAPDPDAALLEFLESTYAAAADLGGWDRAALDADLGRPGAPRPVA